MPPLRGGVRLAAGRCHAGARRRDRAQPRRHQVLPRGHARQRARGACRLRPQRRQGRGGARRQCGERQRSGCAPGARALSRAHAVSRHREVSGPRRVQPLYHRARRLQQRRNLVRPHELLLRRRRRAPGRRVRPIRPVLHLPPVRPRVRPARAPGRALRARLAAPQRSAPEPCRVEAGPRPPPSAFAFPCRERVDARGPPRRRYPRRAARLLREHLLVAPDEARRRRP